MKRWLAAVVVLGACERAEPATALAPDEVALFESLPSGGAFAFYGDQFKVWGFIVKAAASPLARDAEVDPDLARALRWGDCLGRLQGTRVAVVVSFVQQRADA